MTSEEDVVREIIQFFKNLFSYDVLACKGFDWVEWEGITSLFSTWLERHFIEEEVKAAVFKCDGNKGPGPDRFSMAVF